MTPGSPRRSASVRRCPPFRLAGATAVLLVSLATRAFAAEDLLIADFEAPTYGNWTVTGDAFGSGPAQGTLPGQMTVGGATIVYDTRKQELIVNGHRAPAPLREGRQRLTLYADRTGLEVFASDGLTYVPKPFQPRPADLGIAVASKDAPVKFTSLRVYPLKSIWRPTP